MGFLKYIILFFMLSYNHAVAQQAPVFSLKWGLAAELPFNADHLTNLGFAGPVAGIADGHLLIAGGANFPDKMPWMGGVKKYYDEVFVYVKKKDGIHLEETKSKLPYPIAYPAVCTIPNGVLYAGGENAFGISSQVFLLKWDDRNKIVRSIELPSLPFAVSNASAVCLENIVYLAGGETLSGVSDQLLSLNLNEGKQWETIATLPVPVSHAVLLASKRNDKPTLYLAGGRRKTNAGISDLYDLCFSFDIVTRSFSKKADMPTVLSAGTSAIIDNQYLLLFGGDSGETFHQVELLLAAIKTEQDPALKDSLLVLKNKMQERHPGFMKDILRYNLCSDQWDVIDKIPFPVPVTTVAVKWGNEIYIPSGEIKAGVRTPNILQAKLIPQTHD